MLQDHTILGVHITDRLEKVAEVQKILSEYGCCIRTRLGLHEASENACSPNGLLLIEFIGEDQQCQEMVDALSAIVGVEVKSMVFDHP